MNQIIKSIPDFVYKKRLGNLISDVSINHPTIYKGPINNLSIYNCKLFASRLNDIFDETKNTLLLNSYLPYPYFDLISTMVEKNKIMLWFGPSWFLFGLKSYLDNDDFDHYGNNFREELEIFNTSLGFMIFASIPSNNENTDIDIADSLYHKISLEFHHYDFFIYKAIENIPLSKALDLKQLFPIDFVNFKNYTLFSTDLLNYRQLDFVVKNYRMIFGVSKLNSLIATFATNLTMEETNYLFPISWKGNELWIDYVGYVFANKLYLKWTDNLTRIVNSQVEFIPVHRDYAISKRDSFKSIWFDGIYYLVVPKKNDDEIKYGHSFNWELPPSPEEYHLFGYQPQNNNYSLWDFPDLIVNSEGVWFQTTNGKMYKISNSYSNTVQQNFDSGYYFSKPTLAIIHAFQNFIPDFPPINISI